MHISAKVDYAMRALLALAAAGPTPVPGSTLAHDEALPAKFLEAILAELRRSGIVASQRGAEGGYRLARPADSITVAEVIRALDGPLAEVRGERPETAAYAGSAKHLQEVWIAVRAAMRDILEHTSLAAIASGELPTAVTSLTSDPESWLPH